jgi:ATP-dependent DNA helicase RecG
MLAPETLLTEVSWIPRNRQAPLQRLGLLTLADLVGHYPRRHEDRRRFDRFPDEEMERAVCLFGVVTKTGVKRFGGRRQMFEATLEDESAGVLGQPVVCRWFNMPYISKLISTGQRMVVYGRPKKKGRQIVIDHPEFETIEEDEETSIHMNRIVPVHPAGDGLTPRVLRTLIHRALAETDLERVPSLLNGAQAAALRGIHFPEDFAEAGRARDQLVREELFAIQVLIQGRRSEWDQLAGNQKSTEGALLKKLLGSLPFPLTPSQERVIAEIRADLVSARRMNRLLQGDVGSGKTLVALAAMLLAVESGWDAAIMAPTQILAEQHYLNFRRLLDPLGIPIALRTGARKEGSARILRAPAGILPGGEKHYSKPFVWWPEKNDGQDARHGTQDACGSRIVVGTHALLFEEGEDDRYGVVVIDEQHKFGVLQRAKLIERGDAPDVLVMTATPIPRTLTQTLYGDLDVSVLREKPANRGEIQTAVRDAGKMPDVVTFLRKQLDKGRQAYVVYPLVEESDKLAAKSALAEFEKWKPLVAPYEVGLIHGRLSAEEKEAVMARFRDGKIAVLVATTVIEVGVDVPNANIMVVENAERFGLAQLHQLRGRIGRGAHKSYCILLHDPKAEEPARAKLAVLEETADGFAVAEADWRQRGAGDLLGTAQTGLPPLRLADLIRDGALMQEMAEKAGAIFARDPLLQAPENAALARFLDASRSRLAISAG